MTAPKRIQLKRTKGWRKPEGAIVCTRPGKWGNPWRVEEYGVGKRRWFRVLDEHGKPVKSSQTPNRERALSDCLKLYRWYLEEMIRLDPAFLDPLRGRDLCCWCPLDAPCHVDVLLEIANAPTSASSSLS